MAGITQLLCMASIDSTLCRYVQIAMTESMCALMRMREWVQKKRVAGENVEEEGCRRAEKSGKE